MPRYYFGVYDVKRPKKFGGNARNTYMVCAKAETKPIDS
jgi:hypothetical protein